VDAQGSPLLLRDALESGGGGNLGLVTASVSDSEAPIPSGRGVFGCGRIRTLGAAKADANARLRPSLYIVWIGWGFSNWTRRREERWLMRSPKDCVGVEGALCHFWK
jgi:hypothetical protein